MIYTTLKANIFSLIPGAGMANLIYLGILIWVLSIYLSKSKWGAFTITFVVCFVIKGIDFMFVGQGGDQIINEFAHLIILPLVLTLLNNRISRLG